MDRLDLARRRLDRAREHVDRCRRELARFDQNGGPDRVRQKLVEDLREAEVSAAWAEVGLADVSAPTEAA